MNAAEFVVWRAFLVELGKGCNLKLVQSEPFDELARRMLYDIQEQIADKGKTVIDVDLSLEQIRH